MAMQLIMSLILFMHSFRAYIIYASVHTWEADLKTCIQPNTRVNNIKVVCGNSIWRHEGMEDKDTWGCVRLLCYFD
jgi:hypothetical protein